MKQQSKGRGSPEEFEVVDEGAGAAPPVPSVPMGGRVPVGVMGCAFSLVLAMAADGIQVATATFPVVAFVVDAFMLIALLIIWGRRWEIAVVLIPEVIPAISAFPTWSLVVFYLVGQQQVGKLSKKKGR